MIAAMRPRRDARRPVRRATLVTALLVLGFVSSRPLVAQSAVVLSAGAEVLTMHVARDRPAARAYAGPVLGAFGGIGYRKFEVEGHYAEGSLSPESGTIGGNEDFADGALQLRVRVLPWLAIGAGPHLRAFITPAGTARWTRMEAHARAEGELIAGLAQLQVEGWYALSAETNVQGGGSGAMGGEAGVTVKLPRAPVSLRLTYTADRATFKSGGSEFVDGLRLGLVFDRF